MRSSTLSCACPQRFVPVLGEVSNEDSAAGMRIGKGRLRWLSICLSQGDFGTDTDTETETERGGILYFPLYCPTMTYEGG